jgi:choice-of-anchor B domain-containing protein
MAAPGYASVAVHRYQAKLTAVAAAALIVGLALPAGAHPEGGARQVEFGVDAARMTSSIARNALSRVLEPASMSYTRCEGGFAGSYPCLGVDMLSHLPLPSMGGGEGNDIWGWTDEASGREFAIVGRSTGTSFVEVTKPTDPVYLGSLPPHATSSIWRDIKVYEDHAYIVSEAASSGLQYFDLTELLDVGSPPVTFSESGHLNGFSNAHNIAVNEETGYAYVIGSSQCSGGLYMVSLADPSSPAFSGCYSADGYTHDVQCVVYRGPDTAHAGKELCFASNEDTLTIVDVTDKSSPIQLARRAYPGASYTHQGWLTDNHRYFLLDDEADEMFSGVKTTTYIWDVRDVDDPAVLDTHRSWVNAIDHNQYVADGHTYQANYRAGLRVLSLKGVAGGDLTEVGYFDVWPADNAAQFNGAWSVYPFFESGVVVVNGIEQGLFVLFPGAARHAVTTIDLDDRSRPLPGPHWRARAKINVVDEDGDPVAGAEVRVRFSNGRDRGCVTDEAGKCIVKTRIQSRDKVEVRVKGIVDPGSYYTPWTNSDRDGGTNGSVIQLLRV